MSRYPFDSSLAVELSEVPFGADHATVMGFAAIQGVQECGWDMASRTIRCRVVASKGVLVAESRLVRFVFSEDDRLIKVRVQQGFTGP